LSPLAISQKKVNALCKTHCRDFRSSGASDVAFVAQDAAEIPAVMTVIELLFVVIRERQAARLAAWNGHKGPDLFLCQAVLFGPMPDALPFGSMILSIALSAASLAPALQAVQTLGSFVELTNRLDKPAF
jgi:hypothetical protein